MTKIEALELELAARKLAEGTSLTWEAMLRHQPTKKNLGNSLEAYFVAYVELALGIAEGKPVWEGDKLYYAGTKYVATAAQEGFFAGWSWNPPRPETVIIEIPSARPGERYLGSIIEPSGRVRHTFLMPGDEKKNWDDGLKWAKRFGGDLPDRIEHAMFLVHMPEEFQKNAYWSNTQHACYSNYVWCQCFGSVVQGYYDKICELRVRPVRREYVEVVE